jgi:hypothetical protein
MEIIRVAPIHNRIHQDRLIGFLNAQISKNAPEGLFVCAININLASLIYPADSEGPAPKCFFMPVAIENIGFFLRSKCFTTRRLLEKFIDSTLEASESDVIPLSLVAITVRSRRLLPHRGAEIKGHHEKKNKNP